MALAYLRECPDSGFALVFFDQWVNEIRFVDRTEPATAHMREFASRTHQRGVPARAADFVPALIDLAAMPIRVERRRLPDGDIVYRLVGIIWGGNRLIDALLIGFSPLATGGRQTSTREAIAVDLRPVENFAHTTNRTWQLWSHIWRPPRPGRYAIELSFGDPAIVARKMRQGIYRRSLVAT